VYFIVFLEAHYRFCCVFVQTHQYWCVHGDSRYSYFYLSLISCVFLLNGLGYYFDTWHHSNDRLADAMICIAINCSSYGCLSQFSIEKLLILWLGAWECSSIILSYESHSEWRHSIVQDATGMVFFLNLCFHMVVADHASLLMCMQEFLYMAYMLVNYALFMFPIYSTLSLFSLGKKAKGIS